MKLFKRANLASSNRKSVVGPRPIWPPPRFSYRTYGLISVCMLLLAGGIALLAATPESAPGGTAITVSQGASRSLSPDFLGFNGDASSAAWNNPALLPAVTALAPETIRGIAGGTISNYFNWQTGQYFIQATDPNLTYIKPGQPNPPYTLSNYVNALKAGNANGLFNINVMTYCPVSNTDPASTDQAGVSCTEAQACGPNPSAYTTSCTNTDYTWGLDYQIALLKAAQSMGVPIKYIELGNELYATNNSDYVYYFPSPQTYVNKVNAWIPVLKADFPGAQVAVVGRGSCQPLTSADQAWNQAISSGVQGENAITFHTYYANTIPAGSSVSNSADLATQLSTSTQNCTTLLQGVLAQYIPSGVSAWITEWNLWSGGTGTVLGSWTQGLMAANYALDLARQPQVELSDNHDLISTQVYGSIFAGTKYTTTAEAGKTIGTPSPLPTTQPFGMTADGFALSTLERSMHGATSTAPLNLSSVPNIAGTSVGGLLGQSFTVNGKSNLYFVNLSATDESINLGGLAGYYSGLQYASSPTNFVTGNSSIPATSLTATSSLSVPAYSVTSLVSVPAPAAGSAAPASPANTPAAGPSKTTSKSSGAGARPTTVNAAGNDAGPNSAQQNQVTLNIGGHTLTIHSGLLKGIINHKRSAWVFGGGAILLVLAIAALMYAFHLPRLAIGLAKRLLRKPTTKNLPPDQGPY